MTRDQFETYLIEPANMSVEDIESLKETVEQFPYCQTSRMLYVAGLQHQKSIKFDDQLGVMAAYSADRKSMFNFLNPIPGFTQSEPELAQVEVPEIQDENEYQRPFKLEQEEPSEDMGMTQQYLHEVVSHNYAFELETDKKEESIPQEPPKTAIDPNEGHNFSEWLKIFNEEANTPAPNQLDLIDQFLEKDPKIKANTSEEQQTVNLARPSAKIEDDLVTETLAKIHVLQGNISTAIDMYEKLILKFPEKRSYFAAQIEFLKNKPS